MQLKECMEDTADNKMWGDWMLINLCVLCSVLYFCLSSSLLSCSRLSRPPLKGMTKAPGSWLSTHSLIFTNLIKKKWKQQSQNTLEDLINMNVFVIRCMHAYSWEQLKIWVFVGDCTLKVAFPFRVWLSFRSSSQLKIRLDYTSFIKEKET